MIVKPTYVFRNLPDVRERIFEFLLHPSQEIRRIYEYSVVTGIQGTLIKKIEELNGMVSRDIIKNSICGTFLVGQMINSMEKCIEQVHCFLNEKCIAFDRLLFFLCEQHKRMWFCRIEKIRNLYWYVKQRRRRQETNHAEK